MGSVAHISRVAKPLYLLVAGIILGISQESFAQEKIEVDRTPKLNFQKERTFEDVTPSFKIEVNKPEGGSPTIMAPPNKPSSRALEKALQEMIDRKQNWLFYGPDESSDASSSFLKRSKIESEFEMDKRFKPKSERFLSGEEEKSKRGSREEDSERRTEYRSDNRSENPYAASRREQSGRDNRSREEEDEGVNQEFNLRGYLQPNFNAEDRTYNPATFMKQNQYTFKPAGIDRLGNQTEPDNKALKEMEKKRASDFQTLLNGTSPTSDARNVDPLSGFPDPTRREINPSAPGRYDFGGNNGLSGSSASSFTRPTPAGSFAIPRPDAIESMERSGSRLGTLAENSVIPVQPPAPAMKAAPFTLEIPKRKF